MESGKVYTFGVFAAFGTVLLFGIGQHSFFECLFGGFLVAAVAITPALILHAIIGEQIGAIAYVIMVIILGVTIGQQRSWTGGGSTSDDYGCGHFGNERCN